MKKLSYFMIALMCAMFVGCSSCQSNNNDNTKIDSVPVNKALKFNDALLKINLEVLKQYPSAQFYEAQGFLVATDSIGSEVDGTIDASQFKVAYNYVDAKGQKTIIGTFNADLSVNVKLVNDIWCEDIVMTPYVPMEIEEAIKLINAKLDEQIGVGPVTLRHQLFPGEAEPRYFFGVLNELHTINVYTGKVDAKAGE